MAGMLLLLLLACGGGSCDVKCSPAGSTHIHMLLPDLASGSAMHRPFMRHTAGVVRWGCRESRMLGVRVCACMLLHVSVGMLL